MKSKYKYKAVVNGDSIEVYTYENNAGLYFEGDRENIDNRKTIGLNRVGGFLLRNEFNSDTGEFEEVKVKSRASLEEKLEKGFLDDEQYRIRKLKSADNAANRRKTKVRRLIESNIRVWGYPVFLTITYKENVLDRERAMSDFDKFLKRVCYRYAEKVGESKKKKWLKYVAVIENQTERGKKNGDEGALHFHTVLFNFPYIHAEEIAELWGHGNVQVQSVRHNSLEDYRKMVGYMCKYMTKTFYDDEETEKTGKLVASPNQKGYMCSKGLRKPKELLFTQDEFDELKKLLADYDAGYESRFSNDYTGNVEYKHYYKREEE